MQLSKTLLPILVTLLGMVTLSRERHPEKARSPILITLLGITILVRDIQLLKTLLPILVTPLGITILVRDVLQKAPSQIFTTLSGMT